MGETPITDTLSPGMDRITACHWTPGADPDADLICNSQTCRDFAIAWAAWYVLTREASYRRSLVFILTTDLLAKRMVTSPTTALKACRVLEGLGLLTNNTHKIPGTKFKTACERTIHPSVLPWKEARSPESIDRSPESIDRCVTREPSKVARLLQTSPEEKSSKKGQVGKHALPRPAVGSATGNLPARDTKPAKPAVAAPEVAASPQPYTPPVEVGRGTEGGIAYIDYRQADGQVCRDFDFVGSYKRANT